MAMMDPPHPGEIVREECLAPLGLSVPDGARALGILPETLGRLVDESAGLTPEMAVRLEKAFGSSADMWLRLQNAFDLAVVRRRQDEIRVDRYVGTPTIEPSPSQT